MPAKSNLKAKQKQKRQVEKVEEIDEDEVDAFPKLRRGQLAMYKGELLAVIFVESGYGRKSDYYNMFNLTTGTDFIHVDQTEQFEPVPEWAMLIQGFVSKFIETSYPYPNYD